METEKTPQCPRKNNRVRTPSILQMEMVECGAASLAMVLAYHKKYMPLEELRVECGVTRDGVNAVNIVKAARKLGFDAKGFRKEPAALAELKPPMIIHWNFNHFVVLEGFKHGKVYLNDPASGRRIITYEELDLAFTGVVMTFTPNENFEPGGKRSNMLSSLAKRLKWVGTALVFLNIVGLLMVIPGIIIPGFTRIFIDDILLAGKSSWLTPLLWCMAATALIKAILTAVQQRYLLKMETKIALMGASGFFWHILRLPVLFFQQRAPGDISSRQNSNNAVASFLSRELADTAISVVTLVFYFYVMLQYNVLLTMITLALAVVNISYFVYTSGKLEALNSKLMQDAGKLAGTSVSGLFLIETLKATGSESGFFSKWAGYHAKQLNGQQRMGGLSQILMTLPNFLARLAETLVLCVGGLQILNGSLTVGSLIAYQTLMSQFMSPISKLTQMGMQIKQLKGDMARLDDVHKYAVDEMSDPELDKPFEAVSESDFKKLEGHVEIKNLSFGHNVLEKPLIEEFNLTLKPGRRVALVGPSGSGKSTIVKIMAGISHAWGGEILFDGVNREDLSRNVINNSLAVVDQDISMFEGTVYDNISMWDGTIRDMDVITAAKDACIHDDVVARQGCYNSRVREGGTNFSGGQRQRLEIARALAVNPSILILDEATSALDVRTEQIINDNIRRRGCTCIVVAHRLSTIRDCDEIIVMHKGKIVQRGTHDEMINAPGLYAELIQKAV
ncbi:MAG: NHLP family bacteriocin export ABC transporter peptidase/permease/ATPase subunit [Defluviitaleaceae bacterium]|nr:NHLP family bacteriocin export ABC transporter peptidase/permease/ATPase subunit [Defluviitaleaceae bacterium]